MLLQNIQAQHKIKRNLDVIVIILDCTNTLPYVVPMGEMFIIS